MRVPFRSTQSERDVLAIRTDTRHWGRQPWTSMTYGKRSGAAWMMATSPRCTCGSDSGQTGGCAYRADVDAFVHGLHELSDNDALVLGAVVEELRHT